MEAETLCYSNKQNTAQQQWFKSQWDQLTSTKVGYVMSTYVGRDFALEAIQWVRWDNVIWQCISNINNPIYKEIFSTIQMRIFFS